MAAKNGVQPTIALPNVQTSWHNVFDADRPMADISPVRHFSDGLARSNWTMTVIALGTSLGTCTITAILEGTQDGTNWYNILAPGATTGGAAVTATSSGATPVQAKMFRVRVTSFTQSTAIGYRVAVAATGT
jgi:hypothetical protein